jgi:ceramide glucosyltransferase
MLKPLKGTDPEMYESFRSHCLQEYPDYEIVFGVNDLNDPAADLVRKLQAEFPERAIRLVHCEKNLGMNGKVSSLAQLAAAAKHEFLLVNDSDIRVQRDYLHTVIGELQQPNTGLVTCLYRGIAAKTVGSKLESLGISAEFVAGVLLAEQIERGLRFALGSTLAFRGSDLAAIGGFEKIVDYLGDDYELGRRIAATGKRVVLSKAVVQTFLPPYTFPAFFSHQLRWARTIRASRPGGYAGLLFTFALPWALLTVALTRGTAWAWGMLLGTAAARTGMAIVVRQFVLREKLEPFLFMLPVRDVIGAAVWLAGWFGNRITWRGEKFLVRRGMLTRLNGA